MKRLFFIIAVLLFSVSLNSCKKDTKDDIANIEHKWTIVQIESEIFENGSLTKQLTEGEPADFIYFHANGSVTSYFKALGGDLGWTDFVLFGKSEVEFNKRDIWQIITITKSSLILQITETSTTSKDYVKFTLKLKR